jgi:DNA-binding transcriptional LysR family regulator
MNLERVKEFYHVARAGSITRAAEELNISQPALSRSISQFEYRVGATLFARHPRGLKCTSAGEKVFDFASRMMEEAHVLGKLLKESHQKGDTAIALSPYLSGTWLIKKIKNYLALHPNIHMKIIDQNNLSASTEADIIIGFEVSDHPNYTSSMLMSSTMGLFASAAYLEHHGVPQDLCELDKHQLISYTENCKLPYISKDPWINEIRKSINGRSIPYLKVSSLDDLLSAASNDLGIVELPRDLVETKQNNLIPVLPAVEGPSVNLFFAYPQKLKNQHIISLQHHLGQKVLRQEEFLT